MMHMTELEERLAGPDSEAEQSALAERLDSLTKQLRKRMAEQLLTKDEFAQLTMLANASEIAHKVMEEFQAGQQPLIDSETLHSRSSTP
jgi:5'-deoxynucleotidase YfbR-like HD superfamily hydrolase